ncbi:MAG: hypothetical protein WCW53_05070 [Syntrophales bacterium]|jgi:hypothetical protein
MRCNEIDFIAIFEGKETEETRSHLQDCEKCRERADGFSFFLTRIVPAYAEGARQMEEPIPPSEELMPLPKELELRIRKLREERLSERVKKAIGESLGEAKILLKDLLLPRPEAVAASDRALLGADKSKASGKKTRARKTHKE